ncbi:hypothetical protein UFOVP449_124 [uncultured Caudovirales phage]|uniref:Uncharacterized protein n=1 Tax=uncultured Caudovirales phage TaxID=2100421 RepID=A0A6J5M8Z1_9CAUD|nr:hypothetical protein UFOVP449_124 [uncultured Caudovirales phage]
MYQDVAKSTELFVIKYPQTIVPSPTESDYQIGFIRRYFVRKANEPEGHIFEVSDSVYVEYTKNPFWKGDTIKWRIAGPLEPTFNIRGESEDKGVPNSNAASIASASAILKNIKLYLPNLLQFYRK